MPPILQIKGSLFTLSVLKILNKNMALINQNIVIQVRNAPHFFKNIPIIVDLTIIEDEIMMSFIDNLHTMLRKYTIIPVGYYTKNSELQHYLSRKLLPIFKDDRKISDCKKENVSTIQAQNKIIDTRVRSGQQIVAYNGDLIVLSSISSGAEILAAGNIHVYGTLRGRIIAGLYGNTNARIFCYKCEASLISIAGQYKIFEDIKEEKESKYGYQIQLKENKIIINALSK